MRRSTVSWAAALLTAPVLALLPAGVTASAVPAGSAHAVAVRGGASDGKVGDTVRLTGFKKGEALDVTVIKVVDPARAEDAYLVPSAGKHLAAVQFRLKNTGTALYKDSPSNGATVVDKQGQRFNSSLFPTRAGAEFPATVTVRPGGTALGFISFEVPNGTKIVAVQFAMDSGFADDVGEWSVP
ncbi:DUF4352 domain-containing protein [Streptomyces sp. NPDC058274]|uniref:DUF4352 domain-containing protein n=1 Tax=Streptomyces sp. NPDC058274 TaxID=3346416 RepID=UPI0036EC71B2